MANYEPPSGAAAAGKTKGGKAKKDPNAPKRGQTSFMLFSNDVRAKVKAENPDLKFGDLVSGILDMMEENDQACRYLRILCSSRL